MKTRQSARPWLSVGWLLVALGMATAANAADLQTWPQGRNTALTELTQPIQVVNVWASWCAPCRREIPMLSRWHRQNGYGRKNSAPQLVGIALDSANNLQRFTHSTKIDYPLWRYTGQDSRQFMQTLGNPIGALPFTVVRAPQCGFQQTVVGEVSTAQLNQLVQQAKHQCAAKHKAIGD